MDDVCGQDTVIIQYQQIQDVSVQKMVLVIMSLDTAITHHALVSQKVIQIINNFELKRGLIKKVQFSYLNF